MNKNAIKNFAVTARVTLIQAVTQKAFEYEITADGKNDPAQESVNGQTLTAAERSQRAQLIERIRANGFVQTMEEAAYTWFNRFIALRFMEVNNYLPSHVRIFSDENGSFKPEVLTDAVNLEIDGLDKALVLELLENQENERLYQYIIITQCNALHEGLPEMFEHIGGWTELLFPKNLLREDSIIAHMVEDIPEEDWQDQVQIIGWLYQYYNTEPKDKVFANLKKNVKISAADIPAATQLFTPDWIVRYMVENSLGRLWTEGHGKPEHADWKYYLEEAEQEDTVRAELKQLREAYREIQPEQIRIIDPCMGSGHILVYAFDVLMDIYTACGWSERDAAEQPLRAGHRPPCVSAGIFCGDDESKTVQPPHSPWGEPAKPCEFRRRYGREYLHAERQSAAVRGAVPVRRHLWFADDGDSTGGAGRDGGCIPSHDRAGRGAAESDGEAL